MHTDRKNIKILLVCDNRADIQNIKLRLEESIKTRCYVWHYKTIVEAIDILNYKKLRADVIILDLGLKGIAPPKEIYRQMDHSAHDIPIIVITGKGSEEHDLAAYVMELGAADNMIRGEFSGLSDAMEFALIRWKITKDKKLQTDKTLQASKDDSDARNLKERQDYQDILSMALGDYSASNNGSKDKKETRGCTR